MSRLENLKKALPEGCDGVLICCEKNIRYLTSFDYTDGYVLVTRQKSYVLADFRYIEAAKESCSDEWNVVMLERNRSNLINDLLAENGVKVLGFEDKTVSAYAYERLKLDFPAVEFMPVGGLVEGLREYKDEGELDLIIKAQRIAEKAFDHILGFITPYLTEKEVALELEYFMRRNGAEASAFEIIAVSGSASSRPHGVPRDVKLERGFLTLDFGAQYEGYKSDMTRTICLGKADDDMKKMYDTVYKAQTAVLESIEYGMSLLECDKIARNIIDDAGYKGCFGHGLGHGVGMDIHEAPTLSPASGTKVLTTGHVVTVEPGIYIEGKYGVRIEDMVVCRGQKAENITVCPKNLIEL